MKKRIAFALVAGLMVVGYLVQPESNPPAGDEAPTAQESGSSPFSCVEAI